MEDQNSKTKNRRWVQRIRAIPWRRIGSGLLVFGLMALSFFGGHLTGNWYLRAGEPDIAWKYADWQVYRNETYGFGLRYPKDWEAKEVKAEFVVFKPQVVESFDTAQDKEEPAKEYISLTITSNKNRGSTLLTTGGKTLCEEDQSQCSFHTDGIFGERITTPEEEIVFFAHGENDFTITLHKYDSAAEVIESYVAIFEETAESFRFTTEVTASCEKDVDCALGIRLDECCVCAEAFSKSEIEANPAIAPFEVGKDYSGEKLVSCINVYCSPCPTPPSGAVCVSNRCQVKE